MEEPKLNKKQILKQWKKDKYVKGVVKFSLNELIESDLESILDKMSTRLIGYIFLQDIHYSVFTKFNLQEDAIFIEVEGYIDDEDIDIIKESTAYGWE